MLSEQYIQSVSLRRDNLSDDAEYPYTLPAVQHLDDLQLHPKVTFLVGENGAGKSTLLEAMAVAMGFNPEGGHTQF